MVFDNYDVLVLGTGIAGLSFALKASKFSKVAVITKKNDTESNTNYAQGGIAAVIDPSDDFESHIKDTLIAGAGLCHENAVEILVQEGPDRVIELINLGVDFTRSDDSDNPFKLHLGREGGHSIRRIVHSADLTGREIERTLIQQAVSNPNIEIYEHTQAIDLIISKYDDRRLCCGAVLLDCETGKVFNINAKVTMLATGGLGAVYLHTTNPDIATGDGVAIAYRAGAVIANMEFIQFHPTTLYKPGAKSFLISEAVRGEGGILRLKDGTDFMKSYHHMASLAPRDIVARAIDAELKKSGDECVYLDITSLKPEKIKSHFPNIYEKCLQFGIDITKEWIPIVPAAHYSCGGVFTDKDAKTTIENLYACGEVACTGVHGANRLASNSLLEAVVFAHRASVDASNRIYAPCGTEIIPIEKFGDDENIPYGKIEKLTYELREVMWKWVGIVRSNKRLERALSFIVDMKTKTDDLFVTYKPVPELIELRNMVMTSEIIVRSAMWRKESRGLHYNIDYPSTEDCWKKDTIIKKSKDNTIQILS